jgi:hypothetical protein
MRCRLTTTSPPEHPKAVSQLFSLQPRFVVLLSHDNAYLSIPPPATKYFEAQDVTSKGRGRTVGYVLLREISRDRIQTMIRRRHTPDNFVVLATVLFTAASRN